jgi:hypothetical protein
MAVTALFHGWEAGTGPNNCEPLARPIPNGSVFANHFQFSIDGGWTWE